MTTEVISQTLQAGVQATFGQGRLWYIKTASAPVTIVAEKQGTGAIIRRFVNIGAGVKFTAKPGEVGWDYLRVLSATTQAFEIIVGDDDVEVANAVSVTGTAVVSVLPASVVTDAAPVVRATGSQGVLFAANASRKRITVSCDSNNTSGGAGVACYWRAAGGVNNLGELVPGMSYEFEGIYALDVRNDSGDSATFYLHEET